MCDYCETDESIVGYIADELTSAILDKLSKLGFKKVSFTTVKECFDSCDNEYELLMTNGKTKIKVNIAGLDEISIETYRLKDGVWIDNNLNRDLNPYF